MISSEAAVSTNVKGTNNSAFSRGFPLITIVSLMVVTSVTERTGLFQFIAHAMARAAKGDGKRLFFYLFLAGTLSGALFTNDAAVLIFTPLVFQLIEDIQGREWTGANKIPYYFSVLYVANVAGVFVISNPINIIVAQFFDIAFVEYATWMFVPATVSIVASYLGIRWAFRAELPKSFVPPAKIPLKRQDVLAMTVCGILLLLTLVAFFSQAMTGVPTWLVALSSAVVLLAFHLIRNKGGWWTVARGVGWEELLFVMGIFIVADSVRATGLTEDLANLLQQVSNGQSPTLNYVVALVAAVVSAFMNNHPTADLMAMTIQQMEVPEYDSKILGFSALIGGDLGPKMIPVGSLAALIWFRILRERGVNISYWRYIKLGVPVSLIAIVLAILTLNLEVSLFQYFRGFT